MKKLSTLIVFIFCWSFSFSQNVPYYFPDNGHLLAWFPFDRTFLDESGNDLMATSFGATFTTNQFNEPNAALSLDGNSARVVIDYDFDFPQRTVNLWFKAVDIDFNQRGNAIFESDHPELENGLTILRVIRSMNGFDLAYYAADRDPYRVEINLDEWYMATIVVHDDETHFYLDGTLLSTIPTERYSSPEDGEPVMTVGCARDITRFFEGSVDELSLWTRGLSHEEVAALFNQCSNEKITRQPEDVLYHQTSSTFFDLEVEDDIRGVSFQWQVNNGQGFEDMEDGSSYDGVTTNTLEILADVKDMENTSFRCIVGGANGICADTSNTVNVLLSSSIEGNRQSTIKLFPNPTDGILNFDGVFEKLNFFIYSASGQLVQQGNMHVGNASIDISNLRSGVYIIKAFEKDRIFYEKVMKQ